MALDGDVGVVGMVEGNVRVYRNWSIYVSSFDLPEWGLVVECVEDVVAIGNSGGNVPPFHN